MSEVTDKVKLLANFTKLVLLGPNSNQSVSYVNSCFNKWINVWQNECNYPVLLLLGQVGKGLCRE